MMVSAETINDLLPQTQCGDCGFTGCLPYAQALAQRKAPIDRCPPGGVKTVKALAATLAIDAHPYLESARLNTRLPVLATIREAECIGCTKCIQACPVDAIIGSAKQMHVILKIECTGCGLCVDPCPVDCIELLPIAAPTYDKTLARKRFNARTLRQINEKQAKTQEYRDKRQLVSTTAIVNEQDKKAKQQYILQALARINAKKNK
jgi:electron transport complex protein RnfB